MTRAAGTGKRARPTSTERSDRTRAANPYFVLLAAIILPGAGHVIDRLPVRGLVFVFYMLLLGAVTFQLTTPEHSFLGRYAGGLFVYAVSILDAYKWAAVRRRHSQYTA